MTWQGVSEAECYDNRSVMAQIMRLKDRVRALEEEGTEEIEHEIELINEELTILEGKVASLESGKADNNAVVKLTGNQTIMDVKSFIRSPIVPTPTANSEAATKKYVDDNSHDYAAGLGMSIDNDVIGISQDYADNIVKKDSSGQQTISSSIYFTTIPRAPGTPTNASDLANKSYVDSVAGGGGGGGTYTAGTGLQLVGTEFSLDSATQTAVAAVPGKADDNAVVKLTGAQSVAGVKTFSDSPIVPTPTTDYQAATKKYVDDNAGGSGGSWTTLPVADFNSTGYAMLFTDSASGVTTANYEVIIHIRAYPISASSVLFSIHIPKGSVVQPSFDNCITRAGASSVVMIVSNVKRLMGISSAPSAGMYSVVSNQITYTDVGTTTVQPTVTPYDTTGAAQGVFNVCIQYR